MQSSGFRDRQRRGLQPALRDMTAALLRDCENADPALREGLTALVTAGGKRLRPTLAYLCWHMCGEPARDVLPLMEMVELMHTASLIHDDIVDGAEERRGLRTLHTLVGGRAAAQGADYLLACAMKRLHVYRGTGINELLTAVSIEMCRGELWQREALAGEAEQSEAAYFTQIGRKTAGLIAAACRCGAVAAGLGEATASALGRYGTSLGMAFQLRDDLMDYTGEISGKPAGLDRAAGILTLPALLEAGGETPQAAVRRTEQLIRAHTAEAEAALDGFKSPEAGALRTLAGEMAKRRR